MVWVKICGTTSLEDAQAAVDADADALGFIFAEGPRRVAPLVARDIVRSLPERIEKIGVFVNETVERIREIALETGLTAVQLSGYRSLDVLAKLKTEPGLQLIPVYRMPTVPDSELFDFGRFDRVLFDTAVEGKHGGSGRTWDWESGKAAIALLNGHVKVVVAGGLTPVNVADAVRILHPWGVDVSSGVECEPGKKDHEKVRAFVNAAKNAQV